MEPERRWIAHSHPFTHAAPVRVAPLPGRPEAPLVLYCHGMGETSETSLSAWPRLSSLEAHIVAPEGPWPHEVRREEGIRIGHAWYLYDGSTDIFARTVALSVDWVIGILEATEQACGLQPRSRAVVGFSQGAYFAYALALGHQERFRHLVAVAGRLREDFVASALDAPGPLRSLILHGERDRAVSPEASRRSHGILTRAGYEAELRLLPGGHGLRPDRDEAAADWLAREWARDETGA